jgi:Flp pilus assembly protein TadD
MIILLCALLGTPFTPALLSSSRPETQSGTETASTSVAVDRLESGGTDSGEIRKIVWDGAWKVGQRYPLFGSGVETFAYSYYLDRPMDHNHVSEWDFLYNKAHNELLNFWATTGVVGVGAYLALLGWFGIWSLRQLLSPQPRPVKIMLVGLVAGVVALSVSNFFGFSTVTVTLLLFILMAVAVVLTSSSDPDEQTTATSAKPTTKVGNFWSWRHVAGIAFTSGLTVYCVMRVITWWMADYHFTLGKRAFQQGDFAVANQHLQQAINFSANEALFYDELATLYANAAVAVAQNDDLEEAEQLATASLLASDTALELNPRHLNFYKTRARVFIVLGQLNETFLEEALSTLQVASTLAPTDPKLLYNQALIENALGNTESAQALLEQTLAMKPDYHSARFELAKLYEQTDQLDAALTEYQQLLIASPNDPVLLERFEVVNASLSAQTQTQ